MDFCIQIAISAEYNQGTLAKAFPNIQSTWKGVEFEYNGRTYSLSVLPHSDDDPLEDEIIGVSFLSNHYNFSDYHDAHCYIAALEKAYSDLDDIKDKVTSITGGVVDGSKMDVSVWAYVTY